MPSKIDVTTIQMPTIDGHSKVDLTNDVIRACMQSEEKIESLCQSIREHNQHAPCCGLLIDANIDGEYSVHTLPSVKNSSIEPQMITLHALLTVPRHHASALSCVERHGIALAVASSHLQLHSSEWLKQPWNSKDILFPLDQDRPQLDQLYLRKYFAPSADPNQPRLIDETFSTLGIVLLELCFGYTLDQSPYRQAYLAQDGSRDLIQDRIAAQKWAEKVDGEAGPAYADAVE